MLHRKGNGDSPCPFLLRPPSGVTDRTKRGLSGTRTHAHTLLLKPNKKPGRIPRHHIGNVRFVLRPCCAPPLHPSAPEPATPSQKCKRKRKTQMQEKKTMSSSSRAHPTSCISSPGALRGMANPIQSNPQTGAQRAASTLTPTALPISDAAHPTALLALITSNRASRIDSSPSTRAPSQSAWMNDATASPALSARTPASRERATAARRDEQKDTPPPVHAPPTR
ncbi:hypothetical protein K438DRAFT_1955517 [Mycena galopus ATCC 62051]|nr:hypothetical protein K438DRAFT_1955517 [Mycena galopus ATCC 62051]